MATSNSDQPTKRGLLPRPRGWVVILAAFTFAAVYLYRLYWEQQDTFINTYYFRTLQEVASEFNNNLDQLVSLHKYNESDSTILSIFASYQRDDTVRDQSSATAAPDTTYSLGANRVKIIRGTGDIYHVAMEDLMPAPRNDFVLYVIADENNQVLSSSGGSSGLSLIDTKQISKAIQLRENQDWLKLAAREGQPEPDPDAPLPGYSTRIDVELTTGTSRLFILPFHLHHKVAASAAADPDSAIKRNEGAPLYLVGIQPENVIEAFENKRWNLSLLLLSLVALVFLWSVTRLLMISPHQPLGIGFYYTTTAASYLTFLMLVALLMSLGQRDSELAAKQVNAREIIRHIQTGLERDLYAIFEALEQYHPFYARLLDSDNASSGGESTDDCQDQLERTADDCAVTWPLGIIPKALVATRRTHCDDPKLPAIVWESDNLQTSDTRPKSGKKIGDNISAPKYCGETAVLQALENENINEFIRAVGKVESPLWLASQLPPFSLINLFPPETEIALENQDKGELKTREWLDLTTVNSLPAEGKLLSVFLMDENARQVLPIHYYSESNKPPTSYTLAHRDYFRRVRDRAGLNVLLRPSSADDHKDPLAFISCGGAKAEGEAGTHDQCIQQNNLYIQRLLNINTGTRGTTLGIPLKAPSRAAGGEFGAGYILGADIVLPSLSLAEWHHPKVLQDLVVMVVDRVSGQVLYHLDRKRAMVENLYQAGRGTAGISRSIRAGRLGNQVIAGYYHGESGDFIAGSLPLGQWAAVVFIPDNSAGSLMTNTFLASTGVMSIAILVLATFLAAVRRFRDTDELKARWGLPLAVNRHALMLFGSILVASICFADSLGRIIDRTSGESLPIPLGMVAAFVVIACAGTLLVRQQQRFTAAENNEKNSNDADALAAGEETVSRNGAAILLLVYVVLSALVTLHLSLVGDKPGGALNWYYKKLYQARLNQEHRELSEIALTRYPNTIKQHARDPLTLLPISQQWREQLNAPCVGAPSTSGSKPRDRQWDVKPEHVGSFSQYTWSATPYDWVVRYLFGARGNNNDQICRFSFQYEAAQKNIRERDASDEQKKAETGNEESGSQESGAIAEDNSNRFLQQASEPALGRFALATTAAFLLLCWLWGLFYRKVIGRQLAGSTGLLTHLRHIVNRNVPERTYAPRPSLALDLHCERACGDDLTSLLLRHRNIQPATEHDTDSPEQREKRHLHRRGTALLLSECDWLQPGPEIPDSLPGVKIRFESTDKATAQRVGVDATTELLGVQLSHLDTCLSRADSRRCLLALIRHLKAMALAEEWSELRINLGFHSYEALLLKAHNLESDRDPISESERACWAETLMDFTVDLPDDLTSKLNPVFVKHECEGSHLLQGLPAELLDNDELPQANWAQRRRWLLLDDVDKSGREWASINSILLKAGALYRHKWETCSSAEKLALYYLARNRRVNTANAQLLEQLALQGLIRIDHDRVRILNNSLAYFARHAEDTATLKELVEIGEVGAWKDYRLPVTLVILLVLGGIALTSGSSIYLIVASLLGLLGTIGSLTSSAHMIRENLR